jgi:cellulose biosynthesis protein BcsQ
MVDLDPQGHLTKCLGCDPESFSKTLFDVIINKDPIQSVITSTKLTTLDLVPANLGLSLSSCHSPACTLVNTSSSVRFRMLRTLMTLSFSMRHRTSAC